VDKKPIRVPLIYGTVLAENQQPAAEGAETEATQRQQQQQQQQGDRQRQQQRRHPQAARDPEELLPRATLSLQAQPWRWPLQLVGMLLCMLMLAAAVGAVAALQWDRRCKGSTHLLPAAGVWPRAQPRA